jgi:hypothetical protein
VSASRDRRCASITSMFVVAPARKLNDVMLSTSADCCDAARALSSARADRRTAS